MSKIRTVISGPRINKILPIRWVTLFTFLLLTACQHAPDKYSKNENLNSRSGVAQKPSYSIYLAGPEVFLPDPIKAGEEKKALISKMVSDNDWPFDLIGLYPMDNEIPNFAPNFSTGINIYKANIALMQQADFVAANMVRFRGPSMDVGTAYEMGYMRGLNKPVFAYYDSQPFYGEVESHGIYADRVAKFYPLSTSKPNHDVHGQSIENFQMADNLMMIGALNDEKILKENTEIADSFAKVIEQIANSILARSKN